jgi:hypothetical protein
MCDTLALMQHLPADIVLHKLLPLLALRDLAAARRCCRAWCALVPLAHPIWAAAALESMGPNMPEPPMSFLRLHPALIIMFLRCICTYHLHIDETLDDESYALVLGALPSLPDIYSLTLTHAALSDAHIAALAACPTIRNVKLHSEQRGCSRPALALLFARCECITLYNYDLSGAEALRIAAAVRGNPNLVFVELQGARIADEDLAVLVAALRLCPALGLVRVDDCRITKAGAAAIAASLAGTAVRVVFLDRH